MQRFSYLPAVAATAVATIFLIATAPVRAQTTLFATISTPEVRPALVEYSLDGILLRTITTGFLQGNGGDDNSLGNRGALAISPDGVIFVSDSGARLASNRIKRYSVATGEYLGGFSVTGAFLSSPENLQFDSAGNLLITDSGKVVVVNRTTGQTLRTIQDFRIPTPRGIAFRPGNGNLLIANANGGNVFEFSAATGDFVSQFTADGIGGGLRGFVLAADGNYYGAANGNGVISRLGPNGGLPSLFIPNAGQPYYLATVGNSLYAAQNNGGVRRYDLSTAQPIGNFFPGGSAIGITSYTVGAVTVPEAGSLAFALPALGLVGTVILRRKK